MLVESITSLGTRACIQFHSGFSISFNTSASALKHQHPYAQLQATSNKQFEVTRTARVWECRILQKSTTNGTDLHYSNY